MEEARSADTRSQQARYQGVFVPLIGEEDLLRPTRSRLAWLGLTLLAALLLGFALRLTRPHRIDPGRTERTNREQPR